METTYKVKFWKTAVYRGAKVTTYTVRWTLDGEEFRAPFGHVALADSFRSMLVTAARQGEAFNRETGLPVSHRTGAGSVNWYDFAVQFTDAQWHRTAGNTRKNTAKALTATTVALLRAQPSACTPLELRTALREYAFNTRRREEAPPEVATVLKWVARNAPSMTAWEDPVKVDSVLLSVDTLLNGKRAAASSVKRNRRILNVAMEYAIKHDILRANPLPKGRGATPKTSNAVDRRSLIHPQRMARILARIRSRTRGGRRLHAYFSTLYYTGPRPEEAVAMYVEDVTLPPEDAEDQWCDVLFHTAQPEVGKNWTDDGEVHEERGLKGRAEDDTRVVPGPPALTKILREHIKEEGLKPGDRLFQGEFGGILAGSVARRAWGTARKAELTEGEFQSPMGRRIYDIRSTRLTKWLNDGNPPAQVAYWAGNSVAVLLAFYAGCIEGQLPDLKRRMEAQGDLPEVPE
ncbi:tyrosine-type recombinase/integrase [Streptomyces sp. NPDC001691]|uniref:tyrosine-type recombinase/integrase n=1 Tax=Streptomyces sp. NPDC001691 TaxID=3364600 RepID=UPI00369F6092